MLREGRHGGKDEGAIVVLDTKYIRALFVFVWLTMKEAQTRSLKSIKRITFSRHGISNRPLTGRRCKSFIRLPLRSSIQSLDE